MRLLLLLSSALFACAVPALSQESSNREKMGFKGPVKTARTKSAGLAQGEPKPAESAFDIEYTFDREGRMIEEARYGPDGKLERRSVYAYAAGETTVVTYNPDGTVKRRVTWKEDFDKARATSGQTTTASLTGYDETIYGETVRKHDAQGRWVESSSYDREGKLQGRSTNRFGADGGLEEFVLYNGAGSVLQRHTRIPEGMRISLYGNDGALVSTVTRRRSVCEASDQYGNCNRSTTAVSINKAGKVEELTEVLLRTYTYY